MKTFGQTGVAMLVAINMLAGTALADPPNKRSSRLQKHADEVTVFVTGSMIPQRIKLHPVGTKTVSPVRIMDRREIDQTGRQTTPGIFVNEPSVRIVTH